MTLEEAISEVKLFAQTETFPCLDDDTVSALVEKTKRAEIWQPSHAYKVGQSVQPTTPNGHFYKCIKAGISGADEPEWYEGLASRTWDGDDTLAWEESADDPDGNLFDTRAAIHQAWVLKASMAAKDFDRKIDTETFNVSQVYEHCLEMARSYAPMEF